MASRESNVEKLIDKDKVWAIIVKNWIILKRDKARLFPMLMFPLVMIFIYGSTAGVATTLVPTAIVNYDHSPQASQAISELYSNNAFSIRRVVSSQDEGKRLLDEGGVKAVIIIPAGFGDTISSGGTAKISVIIDASDGTTAQVALGAVQSFAARASARYAFVHDAAASASLQAASGVLDAAKSVSLPATQQLTMARDLAASSNFHSSQSFLASSAASLGASALASQNRVGYLIDPNQLMAYPAGSRAAQIAYSYIMSASAQQQAVLAQARYYQSIQLSVGKAAQDGAAVYSGYRAAVASEAACRQSVSLSLSYVKAAQGVIGNVADRLQAEPAVSASLVNAYGTGRRGLDFLLPAILSLIIFQGAVMGLGRAIAGERENGSITRMFLTPTSNTTIIVGTQLFYLIQEVARSLLLIAVAMLIFGVTITGSLIDVILIISIYAIGATGLGMIMSVMARTQEQYQAIGMVVVMPTIFLAGVFFPVQTLPSVLQGLANILPMAYASGAFTGVMVKGFGIMQVLPQVGYLVAFGFVTVLASVKMFKRELI